MVIPVSHCALTRRLLRGWAPRLRRPLKHGTIEIVGRSPTKRESCHRGLLQRDNSSKTGEQAKAGYKLGEVMTCQPERQKLGAV